MKKIDLMVFDLDGTLVRSGEDIALAVNHAMQALGLRSVDPRKIETFVGNGLEALLIRSFGTQANEYLDRAMDLFSEHYSSHMLDHTTLYPDVPALLDRFHHKKKVIITNKREAYALQITQGLGIRHHFLAIVGEDSMPFKKPDQRLLYPMMERWGVPPERTIVIGDGVNDILLAGNAGVISCACLNGLTEKNKLLSLHPDMVCQRLSELLLLIE